MSGKGGKERPVTLAPLSFENALKGLLQVKPDPKAKPESQAPKAKKARRKKR